jgi:hypothetical protein
MKIENSTFLNCIGESAAEDTFLWTNAFPGDPSGPAAHWGGAKYLPDQSDVDSLVNRNTYYSVAALRPKDGVVRRRNEYFDRLLVLVADDPDLTKLNGEASFIIETSPGNYQVGLFISGSDPMAADINYVNGLLSAMVNVGLMPVDASGNNAVRYCRLPVGENQKPKNNNFQHVLKEWNPEVEYSLMEAAEVFGVTFDSVEDVKAASSVYEPQDKKIEDLIDNIVTGESLHHSLIRLAGSLVASGLHPGAVTNVLRSLMERSARKAKDYNTWKERYDYIPEAVRSAEKFAPDEEEEILATAESEHVYDLDTLKPVEFVIDGFISNKITVIAGPPGVGKTSLLVPLAFHAAHLCDPDSEIKPILRRRVIYVTEDADQVERIIYGICKHEKLKVPKEGFRYWFRIENAKRKKGEDLAAFISKMREEYSVNLGPEYGDYIVEPLIVLDTSNATIDLDNENDNAEAGKIIAEIKSAIGRSAVWLVAHTSKVTSKTEVDQMSARGAGAFEGDANAVAYLLNLDGNRFLTLGKRRFEADYTDIKFESFADSEQVMTPWGTVQTVRYRYGIPCISSAEERIVVKEAGAEAAKAQKRIEVRQKILEALANHGNMSKSKLKEFIKGKGTIADEVLSDLLVQGIITMTEVGKTHVYHIINPRPYRTKAD